MPETVPVTLRVKKTAFDALLGKLIATPASAKAGIKPAPKKKAALPKASLRSAPRSKSDPRT